MIYIPIADGFSIKYSNFFNFELAKCSLHWKRIEFENKVVGLMQHQTVLIDNRDFTFMLWAKFLNEQFQC